MSVAALVALGIAAATVAFEHDALAQYLPGLLGWQRLGDLHIDADACRTAPCVLQVTPSARYRTLGLASDAPYGMALTGRARITCASASDYVVFVNTPVRIGVFQWIPNACVGYDVRRIDLEINSVQLRDDDRRLGVTLTVLGSMN